MLEFFKNIPSTVWVMIVCLGVCALYIFYSVKTVKKNQARMQDHMMQIQENVKVGSEVVLTSGIYGRVLSFDGVTMKLQVDENTIMKVDRFAISKVFTKEEMKEQKKADKKLMDKAEENKEILDKSVESNEN